MLFRNILLLFCFFCVRSILFADNIGMLIVATGKYTVFVEPLITSAEKYFCKNHNVTYFVFTDGVINESPKVVRIEQPRRGWPFDSMMRYHVYWEHKELLEKQDYLFVCDADMLFVDDVADEILGLRVATQHCFFVNRRGSYDSNPLSNACVQKWEGNQYFAGAFYGGSADEVLKMAKVNSEKIDDDFSRDVIAIWHDESHLNRYLIDNPPTVILSPSYCYFEGWRLPYRKKLLALHKDCREFHQLLYK